MVDLYREVLQELRNRRAPVTATTIADKLGVSVKAVENAIDALTRQGHSIVKVTAYQLQRSGAE